MQDFKSPPLHFLINPWHAVKMLFNPQPSEESAKISNLQKAPYPFSTPMLKKKNDLNLLKSAYLISKYAGAGGSLRKLKELKKTLTAQLEMVERMKNPLLLRLD